MSWFEVTIGVVVFIHICFILAILKKDNSIMTFFWPVGILLVAVISYLQGSDWPVGLEILLGLTILWASRLFIYTLIRNLKRGYEDFRYKIVRDQTENRFLIRAYLQFFIGQGVFMLLVGSLFVYAFQPEYKTNWFFIIIGSIVFTIGWFVETIADYQLMRFKENHDKDRVLKTGLWSISRHPNYLGEILIWWGLGLVAFNISHWWLLFSPLLVTLLLRYISGVPLLEERYDNNTDYQEYKESTNTIFPFI